MNEVERIFKDDEWRIWNTVKQHLDKDLVEQMETIVPDGRNSEAMLPRRLLFYNYEILIMQLIRELRKKKKKK